jgi:protein-tyrosine phosphatase
VIAPFTVLFVCIGNVCRSPLAERLLRERLRDRLGDRSDAVVVESAGVRAMSGHPMDEMAAQELERLGFTNDTFRAHQLTASMTRDADLVLTATKELRSRVLEDAPAALRRTFTITELAALVSGAEADSPQSLVADAAKRRSAATVETYDVPDPIGEDVAVHRQAADLIDAAVTPIADAITRAVRQAEKPVASR